MTQTHGYDAQFLQLNNGMAVPLPSLGPEIYGSILRNDHLREGMIADYINYSLIMYSPVERRAPAYVALNIEQNQLRSTRRRDKWRIDTRVGAGHQLDNDYYRSNPWDRGHMARRTAAAWGTTTAEAQRASNDTFFYTNACLQHANLNQDEWLALEDWVLSLRLDDNGRISSFSGPIFADYDRSITPDGRRTALVPAGFFKVVCFKSKATQELDVRAFIIYQDEESLANKWGRKKYNNDIYQVTITEVETKTGLRFAQPIRDANPLYATNGLDEEGNVFDQSKVDFLSSHNISEFPEAIDVAASHEIIERDTLRSQIEDDNIDIFIAAAMVDPQKGEKEWISILNLGSCTIDLTNWTLKDNQEKTSLSGNNIFGLITLRPGMSLVVHDLGGIKLSNKRDIIELYSDTGARIDRVSYGQHLVRTGEPVQFLSPRDTLKL